MRPLLALAFAASVSLVVGSARAEDDWFGRDKALHFGVSAAIAAAGYGLGTALDDRRTVAFALGGGAALSAGIGKEALDLAGYGDPSFRDLAWDVAGTLVGLGLAFAIDALVRPREATTPAKTALVRF